MTRDSALAAVARALEACASLTDFDNIDTSEVLDAVATAPGPSPELLACLDAAKSGAKFSLDLQSTRGSRWRRRVGGFSFDSREPAPLRSRGPAVVDDANKVTYEFVRPK